MALHQSDENPGLTLPPLSVVSAAEPVEPSLAYLSSYRKRALDIVIGLVGVALLGALIIPVALLIKLTSPGPVFYRQRRMGRNGEEFELIKFRTMTVDAEAKSGAVWATPNDSRITRIGSVLRKLYIDEFPQWWNVLMGQMSVVGPRPERRELATRILDFVPNFNRRLLAKPGITGLAQINYKYTNTMLEARNKLRHDVVYIKAASFRLDLLLIMRTFARVWSFKGS